MDVDLMKCGVFSAFLERANRTFLQSKAQKIIAWKREPWGAIKHSCRTKSPWYTLQVLFSRQLSLVAVSIHVSQKCLGWCTTLPHCTHQLIVPRHHRTHRHMNNNFTRSVVAPSSAVGRFLLQAQQPGTCYSLPDHRRDPSLSEDTFRRSLKTYVFALY